jgi:hypothetical protein
MKALLDVTKDALELPSKHRFALARILLDLRGQALIIDIEGKSGEASRETSVESRGQLKK